MAESPHHFKMHRKHPMASSQSHTYPRDKSRTATTTQAGPHLPFSWLVSRWTVERDNAPLIQRCAMHLLELLLAAPVMFTVSGMIQQLVRLVGDLYEHMGRRARSGFDMFYFPGIVVGGVVLVLWHMCLARLSFLAIVGKAEQERLQESKATKEDYGEDPQQQGIPWNRILRRILVPAYLALALVLFFRHLAGQLFAPLVALLSHQPR